MGTAGFSLKNALVDIMGGWLRGIWVFVWIYILLLGFGLSAVQAEEKSYVGSRQCASCHAVQNEDWKKSDHFRAMEIASPDSVLAGFDGESVTFHDVNYLFYVEQGKYLVDMREADGKTDTYQIGYTFGFYPLQQYLMNLIVDLFRR